MERQLPKNVRQIGNVCDEPKIYVEDYVDTFLGQLQEKAMERPVAAALAGEITTCEDQVVVYISGAIQAEDVEVEGTNLKIPEEIQEKIEKEQKEYFPDQKLIGWCLIETGHPMSLNRGAQELHREMYDQENTIFIWKDAASSDEMYFAYKYNELMQIGGHYIYYEKNPQMQNYMINTRRQNGVTPSEVVEDRAAKDFRSAVRQRMEIKEQSQSSKLLYATSALLVVVVLAIGVSTMNNFERMASVQQSLEQLASAKGTSAETESDAQADGTNVDGENVQADGTSANDENAQAGVQSDGKNQDQSADGKENDTVEASGSAKSSSDTKTADDAKSQGTVPEVSTVQEQLSQSDYYTVKKGDTLAGISKKTYGDSGHVEAICKMNGLSDGNLIFIGQKLLLP